MPRKVLQPAARFRPERYRGVISAQLDFEAGQGWQTGAYFNHN